MIGLSRARPRTQARGARSNHSMNRETCALGGAGKVLRIDIDAIGYYDIVLNMTRWLIAGFSLMLVAGIGLANPAPAPLEHGEQSFTMQLDGSVADVVPLFGPVREAE